ncbi:MAG: MASE1 domain-containing protein [Gammaproteobacteria bacterium]
MKKRAKALNPAYIFELVLIAAVYFGLAKSTLLLSTIDGITPPLWPLTGIAFALILLRGYRVSPAIFAGAFATTIVATNSFLASVTLGVGVVFAALAGEWLLIRWVSSRNIFANPSSVAKFAVVTFAPTAIISSAFALASSFLAHEIGPYSAGFTWMIWYLADAAGTLVIVPVMLLWVPTLPLSFKKWNFLDTTAISVLATIVGAVAFSPSIDSYLIYSGIYDLASYRAILGYLILIPLLWSCLRGNRRNAATAALIFCGFAVWAFSADSPVFLRTGLNESLLLLLALFLSTSVPPLMMAAAIATRRDREASLASIKDQLSLEVSSTKEALENAQRHFRLLIEGVNDYAIFVVDTAGRIASWNSSAEKIFGYSSKEIIGKYVGIFYRPDDRRAGEPVHALSAAIQGGKHVVEGWRIRKNGATLYVTGSISDIRDEKGNLIGFANVLRDTTERRDEQEKLTQTREQLLMAQKMEAIGKLTGGIAHDFNNLLMIIGGNAQAFTRLLDPKLPRAIEAIQIAAKRGESLTRQLLTF